MCISRHVRLVELGVYRHTQLDQGGCNFALNQSNPSNNGYGRNCAVAAVFRIE